MKFLAAGYIFLLCLMQTANAQSSLPLELEGLLPEPGRLRVDSSLSYASAEHRDLRLSQPVVIQVGSASFISIPSSIEELQVHQDVLAFTAGLRYGWHPQTEVYARSSWLQDSSRNITGEDFLYRQSSGFSESWLGINHQFSEDGASPGLLGFAEIALRESQAFLRAWMAGMTVYRALDPVVLSLTASLRYSHGRRFDGKSLQPGQLILLNPQLAFAVNERITLISALQWSQHGPERLQTEILSPRYSKTELLLGVGYALGAADTLNLTFKTNASGQGGADLRLNWLHSF